MTEQSSGVADEKMQEFCLLHICFLVSFQEGWTDLQSISLPQTNPFLLGYG